jgi:glycerol-3-phosphate dehydrogenase
LQPRPSFSRDLAFVVDRSICASHALGCQSKTHDTDALLDRGGRHLFLVPWRNRTLVGVWHRYSEASPDRLSVAEEELTSFLAEINSAYSGLDLKRDDIRMINTGLILFGSAEEQRSGSNHSFAKRSLIVDHASQGVKNLITVVGARATVARGVAEKVMNLVDRKHERRGETRSSEWTMVHGGEFSSFGELVQEIGLHLRDASGDAPKSIAHNYGSAYGEVLACARKADGLHLIDGTNVLKAEIIHAIRHEMATGLADIVFRRTELGTAGDPGGSAIEQAATIAAPEFGWDDRIREKQIASTRDILDNRGPWKFVASTGQLPRGE